MVRPEIHADLQAGIGARDVEESRAIQTTNLHVFDRFGLNGKVGRLRTRHCEQPSRRAEEKAFHCSHSNPPVLHFGRSVSFECSSTVRPPSFPTRSRLAVN